MINGKKPIFDSCIFEKYDVCYEEDPALTKVNIEFIKLKILCIDLFEDPMFDKDTLSAGEMNILYEVAAARCVTDLSISTNLKFISNIIEKFIKEMGI